jgi:hypothetical protein
MNFILKETIAQCHKAGLCHTKAHEELENTLLASPQGTRPTPMKLYLFPTP